MMKYVWYQKSTGKFSNSWDEADCLRSKDMITEEANKSDDWTLIKYEIETKFDFEFCNLMRLA